MEVQKKSFVTRTWWIFLLVGALAGPILGITAALILSRMMPKQYQSTAIVQVSGGGWEFSRGGGGVLKPQQFFATQFEAITSKETLKPVIDELDLKTLWMKTEEESIAVLKKSIEVTQQKGTDLIEIRVKAAAPGLSQQIANSVATSYQDRRNVQELRRAQGRLKVLDADIEKQKSRVEKTRRALDKIIRATGKPYFQGGREKPAAGEEEAGGSDEGDLTKQELANYRETTSDYETALALLQELKLQHSSERVGLRAPKEPITIHEHPKVGKRPVSPNVPSNLLVGVIAGGLGGVVIAGLLLLCFGIRSSGGRKQTVPA